jgi:hypothetical protein
MRVSKWLVPVVAIVALGGCATTSTGNGGSSGSVSASSFDADVDYQMMAIITEDALRRGYKIMWINPPQKKPAKSRN